VADICLRVDGLPLAIELAAARIRLLTPQALAERLEHRLPLLVDGPRDVPARQQTLRATIAWSYDLLQPAEQLLLRRLSILKGGWTLEAAGALVAEVNGSSIDVFVSLDALIDHSLIQHQAPADGSTRFAMLETIREFGLEQLAIAREVDEAHRRFVNHLLVVFSDSERDWHTPRADGWLRLGVAESDNVRLALEWAATNDPETGLRLARAFAWIWFVRGAVPESQHWLELGLANAGDVPDDLRADTRWWIGANATTLGAYAYARAAHEEALAIYGDLDNDIGAANCLHGLGRIAQFAGDSEQAVKLYEAASDLMRQHHVPRLMVTLSNLGLALLQIDNMDRASAVLDEALELAEQHGLAWHRAQILGAQGSVALARGDLPAARRILQRAVQLNGDAGDPRFIAQGLESAAWLATTEGATEQAARLLGAVGHLRETIGVPISRSTQRDYDRYVPVIQQQLSPSDWERAWTEGHAMSQAEAIDVALNGLADESLVSPDPAPAHSVLSPREMDVLRLLVEGKSDREIAADLFISHHTVMRHVSNILGKLGVESRTAAATYAVRHDLQ
jgi:non-specific serine/threonine protein kinase